MPHPQRFLECSASPRTTDLARAFYADSQLEDRMARVRQMIVEVRKHWEMDRRQMAAQLLRWLEDQATASVSALAAKPPGDQQLEAESDAWPVVLARWRVILTADRNWADLRETGDAGEGEEFSVLREYTDEKSYPLVFSRVLQAFRVGDDSQILLMVYLIELINIDLFNYSRLGPPCESRVYRGLSLSEADWLSYKQRLQDPSVASRFVAVPLALTSASKSSEVALQFMLKEAEKQSQKKSGDGNRSSDIPCLQVIHVISVPDSLMELYRSRFPQSVVSTICAVDITGVSTHPDEQEVLLRGAFFQILRIEGPNEIAIPSSPIQQQQQGSDDSQQPAMASVTANVQEILVINANRDHLSNGRLGDQDAPARALFAAIVRVTRYEYCRNFCRERGMLADEAEYAAALWEAEQALQRLIS